MENVKEKNKTYLVYSSTLGELENISQAEYVNYKYGSVSVYKHSIDRSLLTEEQKEIQANNKYISQIHTTIRIHDNNLHDIVKKKVFEKILGGLKDNVKDTIINSVMETNYNVMVTLCGDDNGGYDGLSVFDNLDENSFERNNATGYVYNKKELESELKRFKRKSWSTGDKTVYLEDVNIGVSVYEAHNLRERVTKMVKKVLSEDFTYCIRNNKIIVPDEYMKKGEEGIKDWRDLKSSSNKNNSIEKRIINDTVRDKKAYAMSCMYTMMSEIPRVSDRWPFPQIMIDGRYNTQRTRKLVTKLLDGKNKQAVISISKEEICTKFKEYWKEKLMSACNALDALEINDEGNRENGR